MQNQCLIYMDTGESVDEFGLWAFGEKFNELDHTVLFLESWNRLHEKELPLSLDGIIIDDIPKMVRLWHDTKKA